MKSPSVTPDLAQLGGGSQGEALLGLQIRKAAHDRQLPFHQLGLCQKQRSQVPHGVRCCLPRITRN